MNDNKKMKHKRSCISLFGINSIPFSKHLFMDKSYLDYVQAIVVEVAIPWWHFRRKGARFFHPENSYISLLNHDRFVMMFLYQKDRPSVWDLLVYLVFFPIRCLLGIHRVAILPLVYPCFYLLYRELIYLPLERRQLSHVKQTATRVEGNIQWSHFSSQTGVGTKTLYFDYVTPDATLSQVDRYKYVFCNDRVEVQHLLSRGYDSLEIEQEALDLLVLPRPPNWLEAYFGSRDVYFCQVWTCHLLATRHQKCPPFSLTRFVVSIVNGILWYNLAALLILHIPVNVYKRWIETTTITFWEYYQKVPIMAGVLVMVPLCCSFQPLSYWDQSYIAVADRRDG